MGTRSLNKVEMRVRFLSVSNFDYPDNLFLIETR